MGDSSEERQFSDEELAKILKTATELQAGGAERGLSRAQLDQVASEVGIDAALVARALRELDAPKTDRAAVTLLGAPSEFVVERVLPMEAGSTAHELALNAVRDACSDIRDIAQLGRQFNCRAKLGAAHVEVGVTTTDGSTTVRVRVHLNDVIAETFAIRTVLLGGGIGFLAFAANVNSNLPLAGALGLLCLGTGAWAARRRYLHLAAQYRQRANALAEAIAAQLAP